MHDYYCRLLSLNSSGVQVLRIPNICNDPMYDRVFINRSNAVAKPMRAKVCNLVFVHGRFTCVKRMPKP